MKGWCYYESRLLGAHHGLLSTYALETMVLYLLNIYHHELHTPLKVSTACIVAPHGSTGSFVVSSFCAWSTSSQLFHGLLQVLHKFLKVFGEFDWDNYCLSLQGPIPLSSFPEPRRRILCLPCTKHASVVHHQFCTLVPQQSDQLHLLSSAYLDATEPGC